MFPAKKCAVLQEIGQGCRLMVGGAKANCGICSRLYLFFSLSDAPFPSSCFFPKQGLCSKEEGGNLIGSPIV